MSNDIQSMMGSLESIVDAAGYTAESYPDGSWCLCNRGGEVKLWIRPESGWFVLAESERNHEERISFSSARISDIELVLLYRLGNRLRRRHGEPLLLPTTAPLSPNRIAEGFELRGGEYGAWVLRRSSDSSAWLGRMVALIEFSYFAHMEPQQLWSVMNNSMPSTFSTLN